MLDILIYLLAALVLAIFLLAAIASRKPDSFQVRRSMTMSAPPERIYPMIANLRSMNTWNPFVSPDPAIQITYSGPDSGKGAIHTWIGNRHVGEGKIEITEAEPHSRLAMRLQMFKPFKADNAVEFTLAPSSGGTVVTWSMGGKQPLMAKMMATLIDCDKMVGGQFDKGLSSLKAIVEK